MMNLFLQTIEQIARRQAKSVAIVGDGQTVTWAELVQQSNQLANYLRSRSGQVVASYLDNSCWWIVLDLAAQKAGVVLLPLPTFFSDQQVRHALKQAGAQALIHQSADHRITDLLDLPRLSQQINAQLQLTTLDFIPVTLPDNTAKITFTSGTSGQPKGVCLSILQQINVAQALIETTGLTAPKHLAVLPFSTLLENIGGIYAPLLSGGTIVVMTSRQLGFNGSSGLDMTKFLAGMEASQADSLILLPELLSALVKAMQQGWRAPDSFKFIAVGGSKVSAVLLQQAWDMGLPVYEGYGLSECASVVCLNTPAQHRFGTVGKPLPHVSVSLIDDEIVVQGNAFLGYVGQPDTWYPDQVYTGDQGELDADGFVTINGRFKNLLISSFGRNISPEWLESEMLASGVFRQAVVFGDARPYCVALLVPRQADVDPQAVSVMVQTINSKLPDYAQIKHWLALPGPMSVESGLYTANGRPVRTRIAKHYSKEINQLYEER